MRKHISQIAVAVVCAMLGFLLAYQYKELALKNTSEASYTSNQILQEIDSLKKEKEELISVNAELNTKLKNYENSASEEGNLEQDIKNQLDTARKQLGLLSVKGPGLKITMSLKSNLFGSTSPDSSRYITDEGLVSLVNTLWFSRAEAISINGYRITPQTGIKVSGNYIWIGSAGRIIPSEDIVISAIGDMKKIKAGLEFQSFSYGNYSNYDVDIKEMDEIIIDKTNQSLKSEFITAVEDKEAEE